ncbi:type II secretion system protein N [Limnohabitans sp.]|uniref:type II secretion system protein N n=1 Tax=Limnohabitans sp. TaxID=1907725 RepID=UPI0038BCDF83
MLQTRYPFLLVRTASWAVWALAAFSAVAWGLRGSVSPVTDALSPLAHTVAADVNLDAAARSLGAQPVAEVAAPSLASRFQLVGVLTGGPSQGAALIAVDGKPAKPVRVGAVVAEGLVLQSTQGRRANLGASLQSPAALTLELPVKK